jgi:hypothetical protein
MDWLFEPDDVDDYFDLLMQKSNAHSPKKPRRHKMHHGKKVASGV